PAVGHLADHFHVFGAADELGQAGAHQRLVVDDQDSDAHLGILAATLNPPSSSGPASSLPPSASARSRIPRMPWPSAKSPAPLPSSVTSTDTSSGPWTTATFALAAPESRLSLVRDTRTTVKTLL